LGKPTVRDIARTAGVSLATVDRVLNARPGVRQKTIDRVNSAIESIGYIRDLSAANLARRREYRLAFVLPESPGQFVDTLRAALKEAEANGLSDRLVIRQFRIPPRDPHATVRVLQQVGTAGFDGVAIMAPETPEIRDAVYRLKQSGVAVVALVSDLPSSQRDRFVGINNIAAGRTAGLLMGRFQASAAGKILIVASSMSARDAIERRRGFDDVVAERFPEMNVLPTLEGHDDPDRISTIVTRAFELNPDISGVYSIGSGDKPLLAALRGFRNGHSPVIIGHELTPVMRDALVGDEIDAVITQNVGHLVRSAIRVLKANCDNVKILESQEKIRIDIVLRENLP
jgi:LacI family transcriptional regulator, galactose operon repressor